jgi:hypothetical protein
MGKRFGQYVYEACDVWPRWMPGKWICRHEVSDIVRWTNHDVAFERQIFRERIAQSGFTHIFANNKGADRADVDDAELGQLFCDQSRLTSISRADVYRAKKDD